MTTTSRPVIVRAEDRPLETFGDPSRGSVVWHTLFSSDISPTDSMTAGIAECAAGGELRLHRHAQPEIYYILEGRGVVCIDGQEQHVTPGTAIFIPGDAEHGLRGDPDSSVKLLYVFPTDAFSEVIYRFPDPPSA